MKRKQYAYQRPKMYHSAAASQDKRIIGHNSSKHIAPVKTSVIVYRNAPILREKGGTLEKSLRNNSLLCLLPLANPPI